MIKQGTTTKIPKGCSKVMRGDYLVWENAKKISCNIEKGAHIYSAGFLEMKKRFYEFLEPRTSIPEGTKITIVYK